MAVSNRADWLTMDTHFPSTIRQAPRRVRTIRSMVLPLISLCSAPMPRSGWTIRTAREKKKKMMVLTRWPELSADEAPIAESSTTASRAWRARKTMTKVFARRPWRSSLTSIGEMRSLNSSSAWGTGGGVATALEVLLIGSRIPAG